MRRIILLILILLPLGEAAGREVLNINRSWRFFTHVERQSSDGAQVVNLPHTWNNDALAGRADYFRGTGNYMKRIDIPANWNGQRVFIRFGGAGTMADLFVNGLHVGEHRGGFTAFTFEITSFLRYGESNLFWVIVNNSPRFDVLPTAGDHNRYGGLYRDVELIVTESSTISLVDYASEGVYLSQRKVSREKAEVEAVVRIDAQTVRNLNVNLAVINPRGDTVARKSAPYKGPAPGQGSVMLPFTVENPILWDGIENPYLYEVQVELTTGKLLLDRVTVPLGLRYISIDPEKGFMLNGEPYRLLGVVAHEDRAGRGPALTGYQIREDVDLIVEMGANAVRTAPGPHHPEFYAECDRKGLLVWCDFPFVGPAYMAERGYVDAESFKANGRQQLTETIRQGYNHPSIFAWGLFSHISQRGDDPVEYIRELHKLSRNLDPGRMTAVNSNSDGPVNFLSDLVVWDQVFGWTEGQPSDIGLWLRSLQTNWAQINSGISYGAGASVYHQSDSLSRPAYLGNWHPERWQAYLHEQYYPYVDEATWLWGWFIRNMFDYGAAARTWGDATGIDDSGLVTFDRKYRKDAYYFYKANWNKSYPFVYIADRRWEVRPYPEQKIRVYSNEAEVELFVNGLSLGSQRGINCVFEWPNVVLRPGRNEIEARAASSTDNISIRLTPELTVPAN